MSGSNELTREEATAVKALVERCRSENVEVRSIFDLALYVIVAKNDVDRAFERLVRMRQLEKQYDMLNVSWESAVAYLENSCKEAILPGGFDIEERSMLAGRYGNVVPAKLQDERMLMRAFEAWMESGICTLSEARKGVAMIFDARGLGLRNFSFDLEKKMSALYQDAFPLRFHSIVIVQPPPIISAILNICRLFLKKKLRDRIVMVKKTQLDKIARRDELHTSMFGTKAETVEEWMSRRLQIRAVSVRECICPGVTV